MGENMIVIGLYGSANTGKTKTMRFLISSILMKAGEYPVNELATFLRIHAE